MKIFAVNGSPRGKAGNTECLLQPFLEGTREAGAETEVVYLKDRKINYCVGCFNCWTVTPGVCIHKDDMPALLEKMRLADMWVFASPLYVFSVTAQMKTFMDRILPLALPYIRKRGNQYIHPMRHEDAWPKKVVVISNCGYPERHHFAGMMETFRGLTSAPDMELIAAILCSAGAILRQKALRSRTQWYIDATRRAGREVVELGKITPETQEILDRPLITDPALYARMANMYWKGLMAVSKVKRV